MSFICPRCSEPRLEITASKELGPDGSSDERSLQVIACGSCGFSGMALYEESRRGSFGSEHVRHQGWEVDSKNIDALKKLLESGKAADADRFLPANDGTIEYFDMILEQKK